MVIFLSDFLNLFLLRHFPFPSLTISIFLPFIFYFPFLSFSLSFFFLLLSSLRQLILFFLSILSFSLTHSFLSSSFLYQHSRFIPLLTNLLIYLLVGAFTLHPLSYSLLSLTHHLLRLCFPCFSLSFLFFFLSMLPPNISLTSPFHSTPSLPRSTPLLTTYIAFCRWPQHNSRRQDSAPRRERQLPDLLPSAVQRVPTRATQPVRARGCGCSYGQGRWSLWTGTLW